MAQQRGTISPQESTRPSLRSRFTPESGPSTIKIQKCSSPNCGNMQDATAGRSLRNSQTKGCQAAKELRPALNRLMSDACRPRFDAVLVWKIDRFGRSLKHFSECAGRTRSTRGGLYQPEGQPGPEHSFGPPDVSDHRRDGWVRKGIDPRTDPRRFAERTRQRKATRKAAGDCGRLEDCLIALSRLRFAS